MKITICDRCAQRIAAAVGCELTVADTVRGLPDSLELCGQCADDFAGWLQAKAQ